MSGALYRTRLMWDGYLTRGEARHDGVVVELQHQPPVGIEHLRQLEFNPAVRVFECRVSAEPRRDLTTAEREACMALLVRIAAAGRVPLETP
jgi:hypothetical protein